MRAFSLINTLLLLSALSKVSRIKIYLLYQICCIKMEEEFQKYEAEINSGSEGVEDTSSEDEESHYIYDDLLGPRGSPSVQPSFSSVYTTPISMGPAINLGLDLFAQPFSSDSDEELSQFTTLQPIRPASYAYVEQQQSPQLQSNYPTIQTSSDIPSTSTTTPRVGRPPSRRWRRGRPRMSRSPQYQQTSPIQICRGRPRMSRSPQYQQTSPIQICRGRPRMSRSPQYQQTSPIQISPATTPTHPVSSPLPSTPRSSVWDENESEHPPQPIPFTGQSRHHLEGPISPLSVLFQFLDNDFWDNITSQTNLYAEQEKQRIGDSATPRSYVSEWKPVTVAEIKVFLGIILVMGLVKKPLLRTYWSKKPMYASSFCSSLMPRDRFLSILTFLHLNDNTQWVYHTTKMVIIHSIKFFRF
ncbi:uncharacterized protein LOC144425849 [Styela clava]